MASNTDSSTTASNTPPKGGLVRGGSYTEEGLYGFICGLLFGLTSPIVGHPLDTVKTKMQAQPTYMKGGLIYSFVKVIKSEGFFALYKGLLPPLVGSTIFRSVQFGVYNASYTWMGDYPFCKQTIPGTFGIETRVIFGGIIASTARAIIETPLELIKVRRQVGQPWTVSSLYTGFGITWMRTTALMTTFFMLVDSLTRHAPDLVTQPVVGPFIKGGVCATLAWWVCWPLETLKSQVQANTLPNATLLQRMLAIRNAGIRSMFRGIVPGSLRSLVANGSSMLVFSLCQDLRAVIEKH